MIELKNITLFFKQHKIFDNFSLHIAEHERVVLFAQSGSGKTTLLRLIAGLQSMESGQIYINQVLVTDGNKILVPPHKRELGMVFQDLALWPHLNVSENIQLALKLQNIAPEIRNKQLIEILKTVGLEQHSSKQVHQLSGGEQQRVALARTLVLRPKILLMDEPLSSLDSNSNLALRKEILALQKKYAFTLVYVTHNHEEAEFIAQRVVALPSPT